MKFRFTNEELTKKDSENYLTDIKLLRALVAERQSNNTNPYTPLAERLKSLHNKLEDSIKSNKTTISFK